jgi:ankyrin repeat protein
MQGLDPAGLNLLIQSGAPVNYQDMWKRTPLHYAAREGQIEACQRLVELGADLRFISFHHRKPIDPNPTPNYLPCLTS